MGATITCPDESKSLPVPRPAVVTSTRSDDIATEDGRLADTGTSEYRLVDGSKRPNAPPSHKAIQTMPSARTIPSGSTQSGKLRTNSRLNEAPLSVTE